MDHAVLETSSDRYVIEEYLAEGGMGAIYLGKKLGPGGFEKEVVLKQLLPEFTSEPQFIDLFLREARISASLDHANIVHTIDLVAAEKDFFIVMEYVRGADLRTVQRRAKRRGKQLSPQAALHLGHEIADALSYAHNKVKPDGRPLALIHRDVSPSNILLSGTGEVKLTDFGIAKASTHRSVFYRVKGKVGYMSPEQARGEPIDARSDVYSLAVCIYEALVGERLFVADLMSTPSMIYSQPVPRVSTVRPGVPVELDVLLGKALALRVEDRFQSAGELQEAIRSAAYRSGLMYSSLEMAAHLADVCGSDVAAWLRSEVGDERGGGTELYENAEEDAAAEAAPAAAAESEWEDRPKSQLKGGTQLTSILALRAQARAEGQPDPTAEEEDLLRGAAPPATRARSGQTPSRSQWEMEETRHYPEGRPPVIADPEATRHYPDGRPPVDPVDPVGPVDPVDPVGPADPVDPDETRNYLPKVADPGVPRIELSPIQVHDPHEPSSDEQTFADLSPPTAAIDEVRRSRPIESPAAEMLPPTPRRGTPPPLREPTADTLPFTPVAPRRPDVPTAAIAHPPSAVDWAPAQEATVVPSRREAIRRAQRTQLVAPRVPGSFWGSQRVIVAAVVIALLAVGIALGVALSDPGAERDDPVPTAPPLTAPR